MMNISVSGMNATDSVTITRLLRVSPCGDIGGEGDAVIDEGERSCARDVFPLCRGRTTWWTIRDIYSSLSKNVLNTAEMYSEHRQTHSPVMLHRRRRQGVQSPL